MPKRNPYKPLTHHSKRHKNRNIAGLLRSDEPMSFQLSPLAKEHDSDDVIDGAICENVSKNLPFGTVDNLGLPILLSQGSSEHLIENRPSSSNETLNDVVFEHRPTVDDRDIGQQLAEWAIKEQIGPTCLNSLLSILRNHECFSHLPKDGRTLLHTPRKYSLKSVPPGLYFHFGIESGVSGILNLVSRNNEFIEIPSTLSLQINVDGLPLAKSSNSQFWPILACIAQYPDTSPFIIGAYHGLKKPECANVFLEDFVNEGNCLIENGFTFKGKEYKIEFSAFICDAPARAFIKKVKGHTGYYGCDKCTQKGSYQGRTIFPETKAVLRSDDGFTNREQAQHHTGTSILENITGIRMVTQFPHDYMHLVCLGVMRKLTVLWMKGDRAVRLSQNHIGQVSTLLVQIKNFVPDDFTRKPRPLAEIDRWKATEFRQLLLYSGPLAFNNLIKKKYYTHFLALNSAIRILADPSLITFKTNDAQELIMYFLKYFSVLYGQEQMSYNVHSLVHLVKDVEHYGAVDCFSAFKFENYLQAIKKMIKKSALPLQQLVRRISEQRSRLTDTTNTLKGHNPVVKGVHFNGPLLLELSNPQYNTLHLDKFTVKLTPSNCCVQMKNKSICVIENIATLSGKLCVVGREFTTRNDFFIKPYKSSEVGIYKVKDLSCLKSWNIEEIDRKVMKIPLENNYFYAAVLLHH